MEMREGIGIDAPRKDQDDPTAASAALAIRSLYGMDVSYSDTEHKQESFNGAPVREGDVHVFRVKTGLGLLYYVFSIETKGSAMEDVAVVIGEPPNCNVNDALRAGIVSAYRNNKG